MKIQNINNSFTFRETPEIQTNNKKKNKNSENTILALRDPSNSIKFEHSREIAQKADSIDTNPILALGYKIRRAFNLIAEIGKQNKQSKQFVAEA